MGIFQTIKNKLGIGGVKVELSCPAQFAKDSGMVNGKVVLTSKSDQELKTLTVKLIEEYTTGRGDDKKTEEFDLGTYKVDLNSSIKSGESQTHEFAFDFKILKSDNDELKEKGGVMGGIGKMAAFANNEKSNYFIEAEVDVKSAALDPSDKKPVKLV